MARPHPTPVSNVRHHVQSHHRGYEDIVVVLCTLLFLIAGALIAITQVLPTLH
jgi:hypothetical protein